MTIRVYIEHGMQEMVRVVRLAEQIIEVAKEAGVDLDKHNALRIETTIQVRGEEVNAER